MNLPAFVVIKQGDILRSVNGVELTDAKSGLAAFRELRKSNQQVVRVIRNGKEQTLVSP